MKRRTMDTATDCTGREYGVGDFIAVATINRKSPQMVIALVEAIYLDDSNGNPYTVWDYEKSCEVPTYKVKAKPVVEGRGFRRDSTSSVTYNFPGNIVAIGREVVIGGPQD